MKDTMNTPDIPLTWMNDIDAEAVAQAACQAIHRAEKKALDKHGTFKIVLAGGTTPKRIYTLLAMEAHDWKNWHIYLGDERCLPIDDPERNSLMIKETLLAHVDIPEHQVHLIPAELGAEKAATAYSHTISNALPFDLVLLGMGEDGHTASLFPGHENPPEMLVHAVHQAPKPPSDRVSMSLSSLSNTMDALLIITGKSKQRAIQAWRSGEDLPISHISAKESVTIMLDQDASGQSRTEHGSPYARDTI